jgi:hypothetical protein
MEISALKQQLTILEVADRLQITVDKQGKALCPFHDDKSPSLQFSKEKNICTCFSSKCNAGTPLGVECKATKRRIFLRFFYYMKDEERICNPGKF